MIFSVCLCLKSFDRVASVIFSDHLQFSFWHCTLHWVLLCATKLLELNLYLKTLVLSFMIKQVEHLWSRRCSGAAESAVLNLITFKRFSNYQQLPENCCEHVECHPHISLQHTTLHSLAILLCGKNMESQIVLAKISSQKKSSDMYLHLHL